jgi:SAM-dependent methyltransferase
VSSLAPVGQSCSICNEPTEARSQFARSGVSLTLWYCRLCDFEFQVHDPTADLAANRLDDSRLRAAGLDIPALERDFANGLAQSAPYVAAHLSSADRGANVLEIGCSWGYLLKLVRDAGASPYGVELNALRARYVNEQLQIPCDASLDACERRGLRFRKIFLLYVLEYVPAPLSYLRRLLDLLEPGGSLIVVTPSLRDALKDLWRNEGFGKFFYDQHAINYLSPRAVTRLAERLQTGGVSVETRQGYSFVNHVSWFLTQAPRTTGVVGGDNFVRDILCRLRSQAAAAAADTAPQLGARLASLVEEFDVAYRALLEANAYGNQIHLVLKR